MTQSNGLKLPGFSREKAQLVGQMLADGWTGRVSRNGHAILLAPDGVTSCSVSPKNGSYRDRGNTAAIYKRWQREQQQQLQQATESQPEAIQASPAAVDTPVEQPEPQPEPQPEHACGDCGRSFVTYNRLRVHWTHRHQRVSCPFPGCARETSPAQMGSHLRSHQRAALAEVSDPAAEIARLRAENHRLRVEGAEWQALAEDAEHRMATLKRVILGALGA